jgi:hypothetical protein
LRVVTATLKIAHVKPGRGEPRDQLGLRRDPGAAAGAFC